MSDDRLRCSCDYLFQMRTHCQSLFTATTFTRPKQYLRYPFTQTISDIVSNLPSGFQTLLTGGQHSCSVLRLLSRLQLLVSERPLIARENSTDARQLGCMEILAGLVASKSALDDFENCICSACIAYSHLVRDSHQPMTTVVIFSQEELQRMLPSMSWRNEAERRCLMWMFMVALTSCRLNSMLSDQKKRLLGAFAARFTEAACWTLVEPVLREFFWSKTLSALWSSSWDGMVTSLPKRHDLVSRDVADNSP